MLSTVRPGRQRAGGDSDHLRHNLVTVECSTGRNCIPNCTTGALPDHRWVCRFIYPRMCRMCSGFPTGYPTTALYHSPYCSAPPPPGVPEVPSPSEAIVSMRVVLHCIQDPVFSRWHGKQICIAEWLPVGHGDRKSNGRCCDTHISIQCSEDSVRAVHIGHVQCEYGYPAIQTCQW